jgi:hypothetical protein
MATLITGRMVEDNTITFKDINQNSGSFTLRNKIINGDMRIDQRNNGSALTITPGTLLYSVDRWLANTIGGNLTLQRVSATAKYVSSALRLTGSAGNTNASVQQRIEASISSTLVGLPVVVSFYAASPNINSLRVALTTPTATDNWTGAVTIQTKDITITPTLTRYEVAFNALPSQATNGLNVWFLCMNGLGANQTLDITGVQLEEGTEASPFESRPLAIELPFCQRYYQQVIVAQQNYPWFARATSSSNAYYGSIELSVSLRGYPNLPNVIIMPNNRIHKPGIRWDTYNQFSYAWSSEVPNRINFYIVPAVDDGIGSMALSLYGDHFYAVAEL